MWVKERDLNPPEYRPEQIEAVREQQYHYCPLCGNGFRWMKNECHEEDDYQCFSCDLWWTGEELDNFRYEGD